MSNISDMGPLSRKELYLAYMAGMDVALPEPSTREEMFLAKMAGMDVPALEPSTRAEMLYSVARPSAGATPVIEELNVSENGTYTAPDGVDGYSPVTVNVPAPEVVLQDKTITENGTYTADSGYDGLGSVTVAVEGSGGGGLEPGLYCKPAGMKTPRSGAISYFEFNDTLYAFLFHSTAYPYFYYVFKYNGSSWVQVYTRPDKTSNISANMNFIEYNGKLHMTQRDGYKYHWVFDGTTATQKSNLPQSAYNNTMFIEGGLLKYYSQSDQNIYVWNEATDSWTAERAIEPESTTVKFFNVSDEIYAYTNSKLYSYTSGQFTLIAEGVSRLSSSVTIPWDDLVYCIVATDPPALYCVGLATGTTEEIGKFCGAGTNMKLVVYNNHICNYSSNGSEAGCLEEFVIV